MRLTLVLLVTICCLALTVKGVPVSLEEKTKDVPAPAPDTQPATEVKETGRQNEGAPAVAEEDDDDDDDDDDEDISDVLDDEDDDDDDDDEGGADDDDDDDDDYFESFFDGLIGEEDDDDDDDDEDNEVAAAAQPAQTPTAQDSVAQGAQQVASSGPIVSVGEETVPVANDELPDVDEAAASGIVTVDNNIDTIAKEPEVQGTVAAAPAQNYVDEDDDDDDDDDDVLEDALEVDDDDDDDEEDDDDDDLGEVLEARKARSVDQNVVPQELIKKYNKFVDGIIGRIRATMARSYDPVSVHLTNFEYKFKNKQREIPRGQDEEKPTSEVTPSEETATVKATEKATESERSNKKSTVKKTQRLQEKTKQNTARPTPKGTLFGLSKIARKGDVKVNRMADYESVKCDIILGPLQLKVEKSFGRGLRKELRLATATTQEMNGRITLRIVNGAATLHSIKVQQPKQVRIDSPDNHDKAREFIWKRSSKIAPIASRKLTRALKAMLSPPPKNKTL